MTWLDWTILLVVSLSTLLSLRRGFVKEALSLAAWVVAFLVSTSFSGRLSQHLVDYVTNDALRQGSAYVILFAATLMLGSLVNMLAAQLIHATGLSGADRLLGTAFGFARGLLLILVADFVVDAVLEPAEKRELVEGSRLMPHVMMVQEWAQEQFADIRIRGPLLDEA